MGWFMEEKREKFTMRECQRKFRRHKKGELRKGISILKEHEIIREWKFQPEAGRPSDMYEVNPNLFEKQKQKCGQKGQ